MNSDSLSDWLGYINSKRPNEKEFGLERLKGVYSELIKKPIAAKTILIAGTNGKGSTAEFLKNFGRGARAPGVIYSVCPHGVQVVVSSCPHCVAVSSLCPGRVLTGSGF